MFLCELFVIGSRAVLKVKKMINSTSNFRWHFSTSIRSTSTEIGDRVVSRWIATLLVA